jgi:hypothetical protein
VNVEAPRRQTNQPGSAALSKMPEVPMAGKARVEEYKRLGQVVAAQLPLFQPGINFDQAQAALNSLGLTNSFMLERQTVAGGQVLESSLTGVPKEYLTFVMADRNRAEAVLGEIHFRVYALRQSIRMKDPPGQIAMQVQQFGAVVAQLPELPSEIRTVPELVARCAVALPDDSGRADLVAELAAALEDVKGTIIGSGRSRPNAIGLDNLAVARAAVAFVLHTDGAQISDVTWSVATASWNRRKTGLERKNIARGSVALTGDDLGDLHLPRHLFLELKRSRERAMPDLFRDRAYEYLNSILEKAH